MQVINQPMAADDSTLELVNGVMRVKALGLDNSHIKAAAGIAKSKLAALDIVNADINAAAAIAKSKLAALDIVNADINAAAAIPASKLAADVATQAELDAVLASIFDSAPTAPARALNTVYQNTDATARLVIVSYDTAGFSYTHNAQVGSANPPGTTVVSHTPAGAANQNRWAAFMVPPNYYYRMVRNGAGDATLLSWVEWVL